MISTVLLLILGCSEKEEIAEKKEEARRIEMANGAHLLEVNEQERSFLLYQPEALEEDAPLVVVMHGYTGTAEGIEAYSGMNELADQHGFAVAYPQGTIDQEGFPFFNVGYAFHPDVTVDDVAFIRLMVSTLQENLGLSSEHVFSTGMSNGGEMSYLLACQAADVFSAVASVSGVMFESFAEECTPQGEVSVFEIHGTDDEINWYDGDADNSGGWGAYWSIDEGIAFWVSNYDLEQVEQSSLPDLNEQDESRVNFDRYWSEESSTEVWLYRVEGGGHDWPGVWGNMDIHSSEAVWSFFSRTME